LIGVDTNILLRLLIRDDARQFIAADGLVNSAERADDPIFVSPIVVVELEWVMRRTYGLTKAQIVDALDQVSRRTYFVMDDSEAVRAALTAWRTGKADFADYLIAALARQRGARTTMTFDKDAAATSSFTLLPN
jgi:predicted nucleic-acid-binding protein